MDILSTLTPNPLTQQIHTLEMHTTGEPTRIIVSNPIIFPPTSTTLLSKRAYISTNHDKIRRQLILEPRGHKDMYGALLIPSTELTSSGAAHIGVLFMTNHEYSTMCGHATIALGRMLVDTWDLDVFPKRGDVKEDQGVCEVKLHAPCGLVDVTVHVVRGADGKVKSDPTKQVSFVNVPSFATGIDVCIELPLERRWPELNGRTSVKADFSYGGAFYCIVPAEELGFERGLKGDVDFEAMNRATRLLKMACNEDERYRYLFRHPEYDEDLGFLYSVMVVDQDLGEPSEGCDGAETGLCYFSDQSVDRSPTGSGVAARDALAVAKGQRKIGEKWTYHSLLSISQGGKGGFDSEIVDVKEVGGSMPMVLVRVSGYAYYTGASTFVVEANDPLGQDGFLFEKLDS